MLSERMSSHGLYVVLVSVLVQKQPLRLPKFSEISLSMDINEGSAEKDTLTVDLGVCKCII